MKPHPTPWDRLVAVARLAPYEERAAAAPFGFATRVGALGLARMEPPFSVLFGRFALRSLGVCGLLMVVGVTLNLRSVVNAVEAEPSIILNDPVAEWLGAS
jgi:uncharacterized SAM-binding protein YcdF (DUF218 family)